MIGALLQLGPDALASGDIFNALVRVFSFRWPLPVTAILLFGAIGGSYYLVQKRVIIPFIMIILVGGVTIAQAPAVYLEAIAATVILVLTGLGFYLINRWRVR